MTPDKEVAEVVSTSKQLSPTVNCSGRASPGRTAYGSVPETSTAGSESTSAPARPAETYVEALTGGSPTELPFGATLVRTTEQGHPMSTLFGPVIQQAYVVSDFHYRESVG